MDNIEEMMMQLIDGDSEISDEGIKDAIKEDILNAGRRFSNKMTTWTAKGEKKFDKIDNFAKETIDWLKDMDKNNKGLDIRAGWFKDFLKTKKIRWWKFYYVLNDNSYNEMLSAIDSGEIVRLSKWLANTTVRVSKLAVTARMAVVGVLHQLVEGMASGISQSDPHRMERDKRTHEVTSQRTKSDGMRMWSEEKKNFHNVIDKVEELYSRNRKLIEKNKKEMDEVYGEIIDAKTIKDLIVIVETYRARCNVIRDKLDGNRRKLNKFPINMLVAGLMDLDATVKNIVELMKN